MYDDIKESLTVLLNLEFSDLMHNYEDKGYHPHQEIRALIKQYWEQHHDLTKVLDLVVEDLKNNEKYMSKILRSAPLGY